MCHLLYHCFFTGHTRAGAVAHAPPEQRQLGAAAWELRVRGAGHVPGARRDGMGSDHHYQLPATERASRLRPRHDVLPFAPA